MRCGIIIHYIATLHYFQYGVQLSLMINFHMCVIHIRFHFRSRICAKALNPAFGVVKKALIILYNIILGFVYETIYSKTCKSVC